MESTTCVFFCLKLSYAQEKQRLLNEQIAGLWTLTLTEPTQFAGQTASLVCVDVWLA